MRTAIPHSESTLVDILRERATRDPEREALVFLDDGFDPVTNAELDRQARSMASALLDHAGPGDRALILLPPGRAYVAAFLGCLYAGVVAVPQYPPTARRGSAAVRATAVDAGVTVAISDAAGTRAVAEHHPELAAVPRTWVVAEEVQKGPSEGTTGPRPRADALALLQYTSGSTGTPKGVMVRHDNLVHNSAVIARAIGARSGARSVSWLPPYHDMGLIGGILQPLYSGFTGMLMAPMSFLRDPFRWLEAISRHRAGMAAAPDFGYLECVRRISDENAATLDLSCWEHALVGAEPVRPSTLDAFVAKFGPYGFRRSAFHPCYGLAEATLFVTGGRPDAGRPPRVVTLDRAALQSGVAREMSVDDPAAGKTRVTGCGTPVSQDRVVVADPESLRPCADGQVGEILVSGPTVAAGYWGRAGADDGFATAVPERTGTFLRTGDLGFQLDGELFVSGRAKDLIIVGGRNLSPHELEMTGESAHPAIAPGRSAAFAAEVDGAERVVLVHEAVRGFGAVDPAAVTEAVTGAVTTEYGTAPHEVLLVRPGQVPMTSSGKVRRSRCRELWRAGDLAALSPVGRPAGTATAGPSDDVARAVTDVLCRVLSVHRDSLAPDVPLVSLGMDSLRAATVARALTDAFGAAPALTELLDDLTPRGLTEWVRTAHPHPTPIVEADILPPATGPAGRTQEWLWLLDQMGAGPAYTIVGGLRLRGPVDVERLREAVATVVGRHPVLRSTFAHEAGTLLATVHAERPVPLPVVDAAGPGDAGAIAAVEELASGGFDLANGPLLRAVLIRSGRLDWTLGVAVHHIAVDGWSLAILLGELGRAYAGHPPPRPAVSPPPTDHAGWAPADGEFWRTTLRGAGAIALPVDHQLTGRRGWRGSSGPLHVATGLAGSVRAYAERHRATPFMVVLAALAVVLTNRTGQTDLVVGTPAARRDAATAGEVGLFVNTLPIRIDASGRPLFADLLDRVRTACLAAYAHQDVPFEKILEAAEILDPPGLRAPLVRVCLAFQSLPFERWPVGDLTAEPFELPSPGAQFEVSVTLTEQSDGSFRGHTVHAADLFDAATVAGLRDELVGVLDTAAGGAEPEWAAPMAMPVPFELVSLTEAAPAAHVAARDEVEARLAAIWCDVIDLPEVSVDAAFLELGGHSLQAARIVTRIESTFGVQIGVEEMLTAETTIEKLARAVREELATLEDPDIDSVVAALEQLPDDEIAAILNGEGS